MTDAAALRWEAIIGRILVILALLLPPLAFVYLRGRMAHWPKVRRDIGLAGVGMLTAVVMVFGLVFASCWYPPLGSSVTARIGYREAGRIIQALDAYHADHGQWPARLDQLTPAYLADTARLAYPGPGPNGWEYIPSPEHGYELLFRYTGPASNVCNYNPRARRWRCVGVF